jgi:replication factor A2
MSAYATQTNSTGVNDQFSSLPNLQRAIIKFIMEQPSREEGVFIGIIAKAIGAGGVDPLTIRYGHDFT